MQSFDKKFLCGICGEIGDIGKVLLHEHACTSHICPDCYALKVISGEQSYYCNNGHMIALHASEQAEFECVYCKKVTLLCNFIAYKDEVLGGIACKRCWIDWCYQKNTMQHKVTVDEIVLNFQADTVFCVVCGQEGYKPYTDLACLGGCTLCYEHLDGHQCMCCGQGFIDGGKRPW